MLRYTWHLVSSAPDSFHSLIFPSLAHWLVCLFVCCVLFFDQETILSSILIYPEKKKNLLAHISSILLKCALQVSLCWSLGSLPTISRIQSPKIQDLTRVLPALLRVTSPLPVLGLETQEPWTPCQWPWPCCL